MCLFCRATDVEDEDASSFEGIQVHKGEAIPTEGPHIKYDFSKHVLIELLDNKTPESQLWKALGLVKNKNVVHKRLLVDPHRVNCRRAIVVCTNPDAASDMAKRLTQAKIMRRCVCAIVIQELLSDLHLFERKIVEYGDKGSQQQLVYVTDLNRRREPASLARYLREKFSPFGTILSVFVSEGKDGYALPEGVIRFAHLSEAFAAELAYDQCAVAMERLSVTTHHNILLSQCDLKARLKQAYSQHSREDDVHSIQSDSNATLPQSPAPNNPASESDVERPNSSSSSVVSEVPTFKFPLTANPSGEKSDPMEGHEPFPTDSEELADVLKSSCKDNLVDCLKGIAIGSESSVSRKTTAYTASVASGIGDHDPRLPQSSSPVGSNTAASNLGEKSWSTRVMGWISEIPSYDDMARYNESWEDQRLSSGSGDHQIRKMQPGMDIVSNSGSYVTCRNGDVNTSYNSIPSSPVSTVKGDASDLNNTILQAGTSEKSHKSSSETGQRKNNCPSSIQLSVNAEDICPVSTAQKRKNSSLMTQKLPLKNQRLDSSQALSEISENETTLHLPSVSKNKQCYVVLDRLPELTQSTNIFKPPIPLESSSNSNTPLPSSSKRRTASTNSESSNAAHSTKSTMVRRVTRRALREEEQRSSNILLEASESATANIAEEEEDEKEYESPLKSWLKKELKSSTNNRISGSKEGTKSLLCTTVNQDVLISVGCSHMTCDFCYPDSIKLLFGHC